MATIRELQAKFTASAQGMRSQINKIRQNITGIGSDTQKAVNRANRNLDDMSESTNRLEKELKETGNTKAFDALRNSIQLAKDELRQTGAVSQDTTKRMQRAVNLAKQDYSDLGQSAREDVLGIDRALNQVQQELQQTQNEVNDTETSFDNLGDTVQSVLGGIVAGGGLAGAFQIAMDSATLDTSIELAFDVPDENLDDVRDAVQEVTAVIGDQGDALEGVRRQFALNADATVEENQAIVRSASAIARTYQGIDFTELIQETNEIANELEITNEEALGLTNQLLKIGFPPEQVDIIAEYGQQLSNAGYNAEEIQAIMSAGVETGTWNIDNLLDGLKEGRIRLSEFGQEVPDSIGALLEGTELSTEQLQEWGQAVSNGGEEGKEAYQEVAEALLDVEDKTLQNTIGTEIFGTMWEDQGENILDTITNMDDHLVDLEDNQSDLNDAVENMEDDPVTNLRDAMSDLLDSSRPVLEVLTDIVTWVADWISQNPKIASTVTTVTTAVVTLGGALTALRPIVGPIISLFGSGKRGLGGTLLGLVSRAGPVGLAIAGVGALAGGIIGLTKANRESTEEIQQSIQTRQNEIDILDDTIEKYGELQEKNQLTTEEVLEYMDIMSQLEKSESKETIAELEERQAELLEKSGLTNEEMNKFLEHNEEITKELPQATEKISEHGNAYAGNAEELEKLNAQERAWLERETYLELQKGSHEYNQNLQEARDLEAELEQLQIDRQLEQYKLNEAVDNDKALRQQRNQLEDQLIGATGQEKAMIEANILETERLLQENIRNLNAQEHKVQEIDEEILGKQESLGVTNQEITAFEEMLGQYEQILLANAGITDEKGNQYNSVEDANTALREQLGELKKKRESDEITKEQYAEQIEQIKEQALKIQDVEGEAEDLNTTLGLDIDKDVNLNPDPSLSWLDQQLAKSVSKQVNVTTHATWFRNQFIRNAQGTNFHPGGPAILGDGRGANAGSELYQTPDGNLGFSPPVDTVMNLPRGTRVWSARETRKMLEGAVSTSRDFINRYANGIGNTFSSMKGLMNSNQLNWVANGGWSESIINNDLNRNTSPYNIWNDTGMKLDGINNQYNTETLRLLERIARAVEEDNQKDIVMDSRTVGRLVEPYVTEKQEFSQNRKRKFKG